MQFVFNISERYSNRSRYVAANRFLVICPVGSFEYLVWKSKALYSHSQTKSEETCCTVGIGVPNKISLDTSNGWEERYVFNLYFCYPRNYTTSQQNPVIFPFIHPWNFICNILTLCSLFSGELRNLRFASTNMECMYSTSPCHHTMTYYVIWSFTYIYWTPKIFPYPLFY